MNGYLPSREADLIIWLRNFDAVLTANPATYGQTAPEATAIHTLIDDFDTKLSTANDPATATAAAVEAKNIAKAAALGGVREIVRQIRADSSVSNANLVLIGLPVYDNLPTPIPVPSTQPLLNIVGASPLQHTLRFSDQLTPSKNAKPAGVIGLQLFMKIGAPAPVSPDQCQYAGTATRQPYNVAFTNDDVGKQAYYYGRWINAKMEAGPWSLMTSFTIAG